MAELNISVIYYPDLSEYSGPARAYGMIAMAYPLVLGSNMQRLLGLFEEDEKRQ